MSENPLVLVVEDEESYVEALTLGLEREGFRVEVARDGRAGLEKFAAVRPDLVLLDVMLPGMSGVEVCKAIRASGDATPIIMVTARTTEVDVVLGLEFGADDYVSKPYRVRELVARMRAVLRRQAPSGSAGSHAAGAGASAGAGAGGPRTIPDVPGTSGGEVNVAESADSNADTGEVRVRTIGEVTLDRERYELTVRGETIQLPRREFELLDVLMDRAGRIVSRDRAIELVWGDDYVGDTKTLDVHINRLRNRIERDPTKPEYIITIRGVGYRFDRPS